MTGLMMISLADAILCMENMPENIMKTDIKETKDAYELGRSIFRDSRKRMSMIQLERWLSDHIRSERIRTEIKKESTMADISASERYTAEIAPEAFMSATV